MSLERLRKKIDRIDSQILELLAKRNKAAKKIGDIKKTKKLPVTDKAREKEVFARIRLKAEANGIEPAFAERLFELIILQSKKVQR